MLCCSTVDSIAFICIINLYFSIIKAYHFYYHFFVVKTKACGDQVYRIHLPYCLLASACKFSQAICSSTRLAHISYHGIFVDNPHVPLDDANNKALQIDITILGYYIQGLKTILVSRRYAYRESDVKYPHMSDVTNINLKLQLCSFSLSSMVDRQLSRSGVEISLESLLFEWDLP